MVGVEAQRRVHLSYERFHGSAGAGEEQESQRDLPGD
jgi:hypothetical protein